MVSGANALLSLDIDSIDASYQSMFAAKIEAFSIAGIECCEAIAMRGGITWLVNVLKNVQADLRRHIVVAMRNISVHSIYMQYEIMLVGGVTELSRCCNE